MDARTLTATTESAGTRLDAFLAAQLPGLTRSAAARLIEGGFVTVDGRPAGKSVRLVGGETVSVTLPEAEEPEARPEDIPLDVVYEDGDVIVVNKPKGLVVHPAPGHPDGTLVNALLHHCGDSLSGIGGELRPGIVHRIDRDTSGLIIAAKNDAAHQKLSAQLQDHTLARIYRCIVIGNLREDSGTVDAPIGRHPADRKKMAVVAGGRSAVTHWSVLERFPGYTYVECRLETGRTHQIRVHMAHIGHPILGDTVYGAKKPVPGLQGQCLHAVGLRFLHPRTGELVELWCDLPEAFQTQLRKLENGYLAEIGEPLLTEESTERLRAAVEQGHIRFLLAYRGCRAVGMCSVAENFSTFCCGPVAVLEDLYVEPVFRRQGIARQLTRSAQALCRERGVGSLTVCCAPCDEAMYQALGFNVPLGVSQSCLL